MWIPVMLAKMAMKSFELSLGLQPNSVFSWRRKTYSCICRVKKKKILHVRVCLRDISCRNSSSTTTTNLIARQRILLIRDWERNPGGFCSPSFDDNVLHAGPRSDVIDPELEFQLLVVAGALVPEELSWRMEKEIKKKREINHSCAIDHMLPLLFLLRGAAKYAPLSALDWTPMYLLIPSYLSGRRGALAPKASMANQSSLLREKSLRIISKWRRWEERKNIDLLYIYIYMQKKSRTTTAHSQAHNYFVCLPWVYPPLRSHSEVCP